jgi:hypothetical protein
MQNENTTAEFRLPKKVYRLLVVATVALGVTALSTTATAAYLAYQILFLSAD